MSILLAVYDKETHLLMLHCHYILLLNNNKKFKEICVLLILAILETETWFSVTETFVVSNHVMCSVLQFVLDYTDR
jgi:hypothetical protein